MHPYPEVNKDKSRVFFLFPFALPDESASDLRDAMNAVLNARLSDLLGLPFIPPSVLKALNPADPMNGDEKAKEKARKKAETLPAIMQGHIWRESSSRLSADLHPHIRMLLGEVEPGASDDTESDGFRAPRLLELSPEAANLLTGRWQTRGPGFAIALNEGARRRLELPTDQEATLGIVIEAGQLQFFQSGLGILLLECSYHATPAGTSLAEAILEINHRLSHTGQAGGSPLAWAPSARRSAENLEGALTLNDLAHGLLTCHARGGEERSTALLAAIRWATKSRIFSYAALQFTSAFPTDEARRSYAYRLCNRYTSDYKIHEERVRATLVSAFDNVLHGTSLEGGCVLIEEDDQVDFLKGYISGVVRRVYLPLALVSLHEFRHLLRLAQESALNVSDGQPSQQHIAKLRRLKHELTNFHLYFRFSHASMISHHNLVHQAWREAFSLDRMLDEVTSDVVEAEKVLSDEDARREAEGEREKEQRWRVWSTVGTWFAVYHSLSVIFESWIKKPFLDSALQLTNLKVFNRTATVAEFAAEQVRLHRIEMFIEGGAMLIALAVAAFVYRMKRKGRDNGKDH